MTFLLFQQNFLALLILAFPFHKIYADACKNILGFVVTAIPSTNGQIPGIYLPDGNTLPIDQLGEGVPNIVHLLVSLATSAEKIFLIEEPENDLHPNALKALLELVAASSERNQFFISTHSNIAVRHLCANENSRLFRIVTDDKLPTDASIIHVETPDDRIDALRELGYTFWDNDLWEGWLILEEASAEYIIRNYIIPWFVSKLTHIRTVSAAGVARVEPMLDDFLRVVLFAHLTPAYKGRIWVRVDDDSAGKAVVTALKAKHRSFDVDQIMPFPADQFERFYPDEFLERVNETLAIKGKKERREAKKKLMKEVKTWLDEDPARGKAALEKSAAPLISDLKTIASKL